MSVLVDTPIWSMALRRQQSDGEHSEQLSELLRNGRAVMIGPVRQEVLSGIKGVAEFQRVREGLQRIGDAPIDTEDYERAAEFYNLCRANGVQGSTTDFLICAVAVRHDLAIYTTDNDFGHFGKHLPLTLYQPA